MRLIDADELEKEIEGKIEENEKRMPRWTPHDSNTSGKDAALKYGYRADGLEVALVLLKKAPAIEAEPVKHGRWIRVSGDNYQCSQCKAAVWVNKFNPITNYNYCWCCGAKMDGEEK